jgi:monofunctional chorismate mutase
MKDIDRIRKKIDKINLELLKLIAKRFEITDEIVYIKKQKGIKILDKKREKEQIKELKKDAEKINIDPKLIEKILKLIIKEVKADKKSKSKV